jgi:Fe-S cluster assembly protein SufD
MIQNLEINKKNISVEEIKFRENNLKTFNKIGFPNRRQEDWKFTDLSKLIEANFKELKSNKRSLSVYKIEKINDFEHNYIELVDGFLKSSNFRYENKDKISIEEYKENKKINIDYSNSLINLNNALSEGGFSLEILSNYRLNKPLLIYNHFSDNVKNKIINNKNLIILNNDTSLNLVEINSDISEHNFILNNHTHISIGLNSSLKNYNIQKCKSNGFFYKYVKCSLNKNSNYENYIFSSGLKFNKIEEDINIEGEQGNCLINSALFLELDSHQEIKTQINHLKPNCTSHQKIKTVLNKNCKSAYQGKIFVKDIAQKTDAYQLSKALLLDDTSEFNSKPELEIYADDVKCSHGSTSGSINEDSIYYLMTRGISRKKSIELLTKAFLFEVVNSIKDIDIKKLVEKNLDRQIYGL